MDAVPTNDCVILIRLTKKTDLFISLVYVTFVYVHHFLHSVKIHVLSAFTFKIETQDNLSPSLTLSICHHLFLSPSGRISFFWLLNRKRCFA